MKSKWRLDDGAAEIALGRRKRDVSEIQTLTPSQTEETFADEPRPNFSRHGHVGLPSLCQNPTEGRQEKEVQKCSCHRAYALSIQEREREETDKLWSKS